jgi:hypothetical protein
LWKWHDLVKEDVVVRVVLVNDAEVVVVEEEEEEAMA